MKELTFLKEEEIKIGKRRGSESQLDTNIAKENCAVSFRKTKMTLCVLPSIWVLYSHTEFLAKCENLPHLTNISSSYSLGK
jgi:hypothetical protein